MNELTDEERQLQNAKWEHDLEEQRLAKRKAYHRDYYKKNVDYNKERARKQEFYALHRDEILAKSKARYQKKKLEKMGIDAQIITTINESEPVSLAK
jgi:hypothetical protein